MSYTNTTFLGLKKADKGSNQPFETDVFNANWNAIDSGVSALDGRLDVVEPKVTTLESAATSLDGRLDAVEANSWVTTARIADLNVTAGKLAGTLDLTAKTVTVASPSADAQAATKKYVDDRVPSSSAWASYTPTVTGGSNVEAAGVYTQVGKTVFVRGRVSFAGQPSAAVTVTLPVVATTNVASSVLVSGVAKVSYPLFGTISTGGGPTVSTLALKVMNTASTYGTLVAVASSVPATWADGDVLSFTAVYEAA
jgi:hypothetical protein